MAEEEKLKRQIKFLTELINKAKIKNGYEVVIPNKEISSVHSFNRCQVNDFSWKQSKLTYNAQQPLRNAKTRTSANWHTQSTKPFCTRSTSVDLTHAKQIVDKDMFPAMKHKATLTLADNTRANINMVHHSTGETVKHEFREREFYNRESGFDAKKEQVVEARKQMKRNIDSLKTRIEELRAVKRRRKEKAVNAEHPLQESEKITLNSPRKCSIFTTKLQKSLRDIETDNTECKMFAAVEPGKACHRLCDNDRSPDCGSIRKATDCDSQKFSVFSWDSSNLELHNNVLSTGLSYCTAKEAQNNKLQNVCLSAKQAVISEKKAKVKQQLSLENSAVEKLRQELKATEEKLHHVREKLGSVMNVSPHKTNPVSFTQTTTGQSPVVKTASGSAAAVDIIKMDRSPCQLFKSDISVSRKPGSTRLFPGRSLQLIPQAASGTHLVDNGVVIGSSTSLRMCLNVNHLSETKTDEKTDIGTEKVLHASPGLVTCSIHSSSSPQFRYVKIPKRDRDKLTSSIPLAKSSTSVQYLVKKHSLKKVSTSELPNQSGKNIFSVPETCDRSSSTCVKTKFKLVKNVSFPNDRKNLAQASQPVRQKFTCSYTSVKPIRQVHKLETTAKYQHPYSVHFQYRERFLYTNGPSLHQRKWETQTRRRNSALWHLRHFSTVPHFVPQFRYKTQQAGFTGLKAARQQVVEQGRYHWKRGTQNTAGRPSYKSNYLKLHQQQIRSRINLIKRNGGRFSRPRRLNSISSELQTGDERYKRLLMINGILYKSSTTSLTKASTSMSSQRQTTCRASKKSVVVKSMNKRKMQAVTVRGVRFKVDIGGKKLQRECCDTHQGKSAPVSRVDIGGATFLETKQGIFERVYDNQIRSVVNRVKQRCIALATAKFRKDNTKDKKQLCLFFCRFGKCSRGDRCPYVHDPDKIAVCTRFLRGTCKIEKCPYSHKVSKEKMPVCAFFLRGVCTRENCPYLHVKVNQGAELCEDFVTGFCSLAEKCPKLHSLICPAFANTGHCEQGKKCRLLHRKRRTVKRSHGSTGVHLNRNSVSIRQAVESPEESAFEEHSMEEKQNGASELKLLQLPAFISLADYSLGERLTQTSPQTKRRKSPCSDTGTYCCDMGCTFLCVMCVCYMLMRRNGHLGTPNKQLALEISTNLSNIFSSVRFLDVKSVFLKPEKKLWTFLSHSFIMCNGQQRCLIDNNRTMYQNMSSDLP